MHDERTSARGLFQRRRQRAAAAEAVLEVQPGSLAALRQARKPVHQKSHRFLLAPVVLLLSALFPNQKKKKKSHLDGITMQHLSEKQTALVNVMVMKQLLLNRNQTQNKTKKNPQLLWFCSLGIGYFGEGKKRVNLDGKECSSNVARFFS